MAALTTAQMVMIAVAGLAGVTWFNWDDIKAKLPAKIGGGVSLDKLSGDMSDTLVKVQKATLLSYAGRSSLSDVMIFLEKPISLYPPSPETTAAEQARETLYNFFGKAPASTAPPVTTTTVS